MGLPPIGQTVSRPGKIVMIIFRHTCKRRRVRVRKVITTSYIGFSWCSPSHGDHGLRRHRYHHPGRPLVAGPVPRPRPVAPRGRSLLLRSRSRHTRPHCHAHPVVHPARTRPRLQGVRSVRLDVHRPHRHHLVQWRYAARRARHARHGPLV